MVVLWLYRRMSLFVGKYTKAFRGDKHQADSYQINDKDVYVFICSQD